MKFVALTRTYSSQNLVEKGKVNFLPFLSLSIESDQRIPDIINIIKKKIKDNNWDIKRDQCEICEEVLRLVQEKRFYGQYNEELGKHFAEIARCSNLIRYNKDRKDPGIDKKLENWKKQLSVSEDFVIRAGLKQIGRQDLKDFKSGTACCREYSVATSAILQNIGIENNICAGIGHYDLSSNGGNLHVFLQLKNEKKDIIETTVPPEKCYLGNLNGGDVSRGMIVEVKSGDGKKCYGGGKASPSDVAMIVASGFNMKVVYNVAKSNYADYLQIGPKTDVHEAKEFMQKHMQGFARGKNPEKVTLKNAEIVLHNYLTAMDSGSGIFNCGAYDGLVTNDELRKLCKKLGIKEELFKGDFKEDLRAINWAATLKELDKNKDGLLSQKELVNYQGLGINSVLFGENANSVSAKSAGYKQQTASVRSHE